jgi:hypothetical protein
LEFSVCVIVTTALPEGFPNFSEKNIPMCL